MTQFGIDNSANEVDRLLPLPYLPTYIARRPTKPKLNSNDTIPSYSLLYANNWPKASDNYAAEHWNPYDTPFIDVDLDSILTSPKEYDTYKQYLFQQSTVDTAESLNRIRPFTFPNHLTQTSQKWSQFLDEYPDRFKIDYPLADVENDLYIQKRPGRYPYQTTEDLTNLYTGMTSPIGPTTNPFRQLESMQPYTTTHPIWKP